MIPMDMLLSTIRGLTADMLQQELDISIRGIGSLMMLAFSEQFGLLAKRTAGILAKRTETGIKQSLDILSET